MGKYNFKTPLAYMNKKYSTLFCGLHSGFNLCCILFYEYIHKPYYHSGNNDEIVDMSVFMKDTWYVPCPDCIDKIIRKVSKPVKAKPCDCFGHLDCCE